jgi:hypothetical protein
MGYGDIWKALKTYFLLIKKLAMYAPIKDLLGP